MKKYFVFNRSQRNGVFFLVAIIIILQLFYIFQDQIFSSPGNNPYSEMESVAFQHTIDSLKLVKLEKSKPKIYPFNPNFVTDYKGYTLGMSVSEIDKLLAYREKDLWVNSAEEFQKVTGVSDSLLLVISPYFKFPDFITNPPKVSSSKLTKYSSNNSVNDLNLATPEDLQQVNGIGEVLSNRIISYRNKIGGFRDDIQLKDIYGLSFETREKLSNNFKVLNNPEINLLSIQTATLVELAEIPYINYELAREIISYRQLHEGISNFEELAKIKAFPSEKIDRIALYLTLK